MASITEAVTEIAGNFCHTVGGAYYFRMTRAADAPSSSTNPFTI